MASPDHPRSSGGQGSSVLLNMSPDKLLETHTVAQAEVVAAQLTR